MTTSVDHQLGTQLVLRGELSFSGKAHFEGHLVGQIRGGQDDPQATLMVSPEGRVDGAISCPVLIVGGRVTGDIMVKNLTVRRGGRVSGRIWCESCCIDEGGTLEGPLVMEAAP